MKTAQVESAAMQSPVSLEERQNSIRVLHQLFDHGFELIELRRTDGAWILDLESERVDWLKKPMQVEVSQKGLIKTTGSDRQPTDFYTWTIHNMEANNE